MQVNSEIRHYAVCPVCSSSIKMWRVKKTCAASYSMDLCRSCGFSFVNPRPSLSFLMDYYSSFGHHFGAGEEAPSLRSVLEQELQEPNSTVDARRLVSTIQSLSTSGSGSRFLDVGCGYGFFSKEAQSAGFQVQALELASNEREIAKAMTGLSPVACSFEEFECAPGSQSVVLMSQILEHALDINFWIEKARGLLAEGGILAIALPNYGSIFRMLMQEHEPYITPPEHLNFFSRKSLSRLLDKHGFKVEAVQWVSRIPKRAFEGRVPRLGRPLLPAINATSSTMLKVVDGLRLGMIVNVYGRKLGA